MTKQTTQEFIAARSKIILSEISELRQELAALRALKSSISGTKNRLNGDSQTSRRGGGPTFQDMIIEVLQPLPLGTDAMHILSLIDQKFSKKIQRSSISPQLSRLKQKGILELNDNVWSLTEEYKAQKKEPSEEGSDLV